MAALLASLASSVLGGLDVGKILAGAGRVVGAGASALGEELSSIGKSPEQEALEQKKERDKTRNEYIPARHNPPVKGQPYNESKAKFQHVVYDKYSKPKYDVGQRHKVDMRQKPMDVKHKNPVKQKQYEMLKQSFTKQQNLYGREGY